jgi:hypothetical protein
LTYPSNWGVVDERVAGDSRIRLGRIDPDETIFATYDGAIYGRMYPTDLYTLGAIVNRHSLSIAFNHAHTGNLLGDLVDELPKFNHLQHDRYDMIRNMKTELPNIIPDYGSYL